MKQFRVIVGIAILAGVVSGCASQQAPIVEPPTPAQKAAIIQQIQNDPKLSPAMKQQYLYWQGKASTNYSDRGTEPTAANTATANTSATPK